MGQLITTIVGGVVGFLIGGPMGASIGMALGGMIGATLFGPTIQGPRLNDLKVTASTYGTAIPEIYGTVRLGGNLIWTAGIKETKKTSRAGKGGPKQTTYTYSASFATAICKGEITDVTRIWADNKLIYDVTNGSTRAPLSSGSSGVLAPIVASYTGNNNKKRKYSFRIYRGDEEQVPDSLIEADKGVGNVSGHRGLCYVVFQDMPLADFGNRIPQLTFEVTKTRRESFPSITVKEANGSLLSRADNRFWMPDWDNGRLYSTSSVGTDVLNLDTMTLERSTTSFRLNGSNRYAFAPHSNRYYGVAGLSNSEPLLVYDLTSLSYIGRYGVTSRSLSGYYYVGGPLAGQFALGNSFDNNVGETLTGGIIVCVGWTRDTWILGGGVPIGWYKASWVPAYMFPAMGSVYGWRNAGGNLQVQDFITGGIGTYTLRTNNDSNPDTYWVQGSKPDSTINLRAVPGETFAARICLFDPTDSCIFAVGFSGPSETPAVLKYSLATNTYKFRRLHPGMGVTGSRMNWSRLAGGTFGYLFTQYRQPSAMVQIDLQNGDWIRNGGYSTSAWGESLYAGSHQHWDDLSSSVIVETLNNYRRIFFNNSIAGLKLRDVITDIVVNSGELTAADIDVTGITDQDIIGIAIDRESSARDALKLLATGYMFDAYESDYKLKFRSRGGASQATIPESWVARNGEEVLTENLTQELEMPLKISVNYYDITRDHQQGTQSSKRNAGSFPTMWTAKEDVVDLPMVMTPDMAKRNADKLLKMTWANRTGLQFTLPWRYLKYDPTDIVTITVGNVTHVTRLTEVTVGADFTIETKGVTEKAAAYTSTVTGNAGAAPLQTIGSSFPVFPIVINTPLLRDDDYDTSANAICYISAGTYSFNFDGALIYMDDGIEYRNVGSVTGETVTGTTLNALPFTTAYESTDEKSVLRVRLIGDAELESITQEDMLNTDANAALVGDEIIQFREAEQQSNGEWWLTGLLRARRGTNYALKTHSVGETFLLLDAQAVSMFSRSPDNWNSNRNFKAINEGDLLDDARAYNYDLEPRDLMPYTPEDVKITDDGTTITLTMQRRSRVTAPLRDGVSTIHHKEGDKLAAKINWSMFKGRTLAFAASPGTPTLTGVAPLFDENGVDVPIEISFPLADVTSTATGTFLIQMQETGIGGVTGIPKIIQFDRLSQDRWNKTDFY